LQLFSTALSVGDNGNEIVDKPYNFLKWKKLGKTPKWECII
jgi:hypothetical protein